MADTRRCPDCGEALVGNGPGGLCSRCLIRRISPPSDWVGSNPGAVPDGTTITAGSHGDGALAVPTRVAPTPDETIPAENGSRGIPERLGNYEVQGELGRGGMGVVYLARQIRLDRPVALKMIRRDVELGEPERRRFRNESLAVAQLDHPGIVPIYEVGEVAGRPFFSMKWIEGGSLNRRLTTFANDPRAAASLLVAIAEAVYHAHVRGVLHRDLKPSNILIDHDGQPIVTDFGLAKWIEGGDEQTEYGAVLGTPAYMSPEQAGGNPSAVTTASDVYGLGSILYALLVGKAPHKGSTPAETLQAVREQPPIAPRKVNSNVARDLETICLKCLEKEPARRYATAQAIADDLRAWLDGRPISARPASRAERLGLWCRRNPAVAGLTAALLVAIVAGSVGIVANWRKVLHERDQLVESRRRERRESMAAQEISRLLTDGLLNYSYPTNRGLTVLELLDQLAPTIDTAYKDRPDLEAAVRRVVGDAYRAQGKLDLAAFHQERAFALAASLPPDDELGRLQSQHRMAALRLDQGRTAEAESLAQTAYDGFRRILGETDPESLDTANLLASTLRANGKPGQAGELFSQASETARRILGELHHTTIVIDSNLAELAIEAGRYPEAEAGIRNVLKRLDQLQPPPGNLLAQARSNLAGVYYQTNRLAEAEAEYSAALDWGREVLGWDHATAVQTRNNLSAVLLKQKRLDEALRLLEDLENIDPNETRLAHEWVDARHTLAMVLFLRGEADRAETLLRWVVTWHRERSPEGPDLARLLMDLGSAQADLRRWDDAIDSATEGLAILERSQPQDGRRITGGRSLLGWCLLEVGRLDEAESFLRKALEYRLTNPPAARWTLGLVQSRLGWLLVRRGARQEAGPLLAEGFAGITSDPEAPPNRRKEALARLVGFAENWPVP